MLCTRCGKRPAVVFVSNNNSKDAPTAGYCLTCAKELGIKPVEDLISKMGISDEDLENVQDQMNTLMNSMGDGDMSQLMEQLGADNLAEQMGDFAKDGDGSEDDDFSHGAPAFPAFFNSMFGGQNNNDIDFYVFSTLRSPKYRALHGCCHIAQDTPPGVCRINSAAIH